MTPAPLHLICPSCAAKAMPQTAYGWTGGTLGVQVCWWCRRVWEIGKDREKEITDDADD